MDQERGEQFDLQEETNGGSVEASRMSRFGWLVFALGLAPGVRAASAGAKHTCVVLEGGSIKVRHLGTQSASSSYVCVEEVVAS